MNKFSIWSKFMIPHITSSVLKLTIIDFWRNIRRKPLIKTRCHRCGNKIEDVKKIKLEINTVNIRLGDHIIDFEYCHDCYKKIIDLITLFNIYRVKKDRKANKNSWLCRKMINEKVFKNLFIQETSNEKNKN